MTTPAGHQRQRRYNKVLVSDIYIHILYTLCCEKVIYCYILSYIYKIRRVTNTSPTCHQHVTIRYDILL